MLMRILIVAPEVEGSPLLESTPEVRAIQTRHSVYLLQGRDVTVAKLFDTVDRSKFDAIHFAAKLSDRGIEMARDELLEPDDCAQVARTAHARIVVFSVCESSMLASYIVNHGVEFSFYSNYKLDDVSAWKFTLTFYNALENGHANDIVGAYLVADNGDGLFGWTMNPRLAAETLKAVGLTKPKSGWPVANWQVILVILLAILSLTMSGYAIIGR